MSRYTKPQEIEVICPGNPSSWGSVEHGVDAESQLGKRDGSHRFSSSRPLDTPVALSGGLGVTLHELAREVWIVDLPDTSPRVERQLHPAVVGEGGVGDLDQE